MGGEVVHAVGGERTNYWPVKSRLTDSTRPLDVARALLAASGATELYVADLDAIRWGVGAEGVGEMLAGLDCELLIDQGGTRIAAAAANVARSTPSNAASMPRSTSAMPGPRERSSPSNCATERWSMAGRTGACNPTGAMGVVRRAYDLGYRAFVVLDLARVGLGGGRERKPYSVRSATSSPTWNSSPAAA